MSRPALAAPLDPLCTPCNRQSATSRVSRGTSGEDNQCRVQLRRVGVVHSQGDVDGVYLELQRIGAEHRHSSTTESGLRAP